jgi:PAS domain S-box-containing protein
MSGGGFAACRSDPSLLESVEEERGVSVPTGQIEDILSSPYVARLIWEHFSDTIFILDPDGKFLYINQVGQQLTGRRRQDWLGKHFLSLLHPEDVPQAVAGFEEGLRGRQLPLEVRISHVSGHYVRLSVNSTPIYNTEGELVALFSIAHDITQFRQVQDEIQRHNEILVALHSIGQDLASPSETYKLLRRSLKTLLDLLQLDAGAVLRLHQPRPRVKLPRIFQGPHRVCVCIGARDSKQPCPCTDLSTFCDILQVPEDRKWSAISQKDDSSFHVCLPLAAGAYLEGFLHLISARPRNLSEIELRTLRSVGNQMGVVLQNSRLFHSLRLQVDRFKALMKASENILSQKSLSTTLEAIVDEAVRILHADRCAIYLRNRQTGRLDCALARGLSSSYVRAVIEKIEHLPGGKLLAQPRPIVISDITEVEAIREMAAREGIRTVAIFPLETGDELLGGITFYHDETQTYSEADLEIGQLFGHQVAIAVQNAWHFEEAERRACEVEAKNRELEEFVSIASHDLRSPLISIEGFVSRFLHSYGEELDEEGRRYLRRVSENTHYMYTLIQSLLDLSRASSQVEPPQECDLNEVVAEVVRNLEPAIAERHGQVEIRALPRLLADRVRIRQVFANLLDNAVKYAHPERRLRIEVGYDPPDLYVRDNGVGIPSNKREAVFYSLCRLHEVSCDGLGMGLSIVKKIVERHGGSVWVESDGCSGSTFFLRFTPKSILSTPVDG